MNWLEKQAIRQTPVWFLLVTLGGMLSAGALTVPYILAGGKPGLLHFFIGLVGGLIWGMICANYRLKMRAKFENSNLE